MPPRAAAAVDFLILELLAGNRRIPHAVFHYLLASLSSPSAFPRTSQRLRQALVLRALDAALHTEAGASSGSCSVLLHKAREVLADPDVAACFPHRITVAENEESDEARAAAAVADLKRLLDLEWDNLPPSTLERALDGIAGDGSHQTWAAADHTKRTKLGLLVGESTEREILAKLMQDGSASGPPIPPKVADNERNADEADGAGRDDEVHSLNETSEADAGHEGMTGNQNASVKGAEGHAGQEGMAGHENASVKEAEGHAGQEGMAGHQNAPVKGAEGQGSEKSAHASKKGNLMERNPNSTTYESDDSDDDQQVRKRKLHPVERNQYPSPTCAHKIRKKWSEIEIKTLLEGVEKYGKGSWKDIKLAYPDVFEERSTVDLKDKFRNLERRHHESSTASWSLPEATEDKLLAKRARRENKMPRDQARWEEHEVKLLLRLALEEKEKFNWNHFGLTREGWRNIYPFFPQYSNTQLTNKFDFLKNKYRAWKDAQGATGLGRNKQTGGIDADPEYWTAQDGSQPFDDDYPHGAGTSNAAAARAHPPPFLNELEALWGDRNTNTGIYMSGGGIGSYTPPHGVSQHDHSGPTTHQSGSKRSRADQVVDSPRKKCAEYLEKIFESLAARSTSRDRQRTREQEEVDEAMELLRADGVPAPSDLYYTALEQFTNSVSRRAFLNMDSPQVRLGWLAWLVNKNQK